MMSRVITWVNSNWNPSVFSAGFKEGGKRKKKYKEVQKKKSTKRNPVKLDSSETLCSYNI